MRKIILFFGFAGCVPANYYVADIHTSNGVLVQEKCSIDYRGHATTDDCHDEPITPPAPVAAQPLPRSAG